MYVCLAEAEREREVCIKQERQRAAAVCPVALLLLLVVVVVVVAGLVKYANARLAGGRVRAPIVRAKIPMQISAPIPLTPLIVHSARSFPISFFFSTSLSTPSLSFLLLLLAFPIAKFTLAIARNQHLPELYFFSPIVSFSRSFSLPFVVFFFTFLCERGNANETSFLIWILFGSKFPVDFLL